METLIVERSAGVVTVTMNRPERKNALTATMLEELRDTFDAVERTPSDRALVLTGAGGEFCSGADLTGGAELLEGGDPILFQARRAGDAALALHRLSKPTLAKVDGVAVGGGLSLALGCDLVVASERARFSLIFVRRALSIDLGASWLLPRRIGAAAAKELAFFGDMFDAGRACALGLVNRVVPTDELDAAVDEWATRLAAAPPIALSVTKGLLDLAWSVSMADALEAEARCQSVNAATADTKEALDAFAERRQPRFSGR